MCTKLLCSLTTLFQIIMVLMQDPFLTCQGLMASAKGCQGKKCNHPAKLLMNINFSDRWLGKGYHPPTAKGLIITGPTPCPPGSQVLSTTSSAPSWSFFTATMVPITDTRHGQIWGNINTDPKQRQGEIINTTFSRYCSLMQGQLFYIQQINNNLYFH